MLSNSGIGKSVASVLNKLRCELSSPRLGLCYPVQPYLMDNIAINMADTYGYAPRYAELKSARDYFEGGFLGTYKTWVTGYSEYMLSHWRLYNHSSTTPTKHIFTITSDPSFKCPRNHPQNNL